MALEPYAFVRISIALLIDSWSLHHILRARAAEAAQPLLAGEAAMAPSTSAATPKRGDIVVSRAHDGLHGYELSIFGGAPQVACATREDAVANADRFARTHDVDVWQTQDGRTFTRIFEARRATPSRQDCEMPPCRLK